MPIPIQSRFTTNDGYYATAANLLSSTDRLELWNTFIDTYYQKDTNDLGDPGDLGEAGRLGYTDRELEYKIPSFVNGFYASVVQSFFYGYLPTLSTQPSTTQEVKDAWYAYLINPDRSSVAYRQNMVILWVWNVLLEALKEIQQGTPLRARMAIAFSQAEQTAVEKMANIEFTAQEDENDFDTQAENMNKQQAAETFRAWRGIVGKNTQTAQQRTSQDQEQISQHIQLMSTMLQQLENLVGSIIKR